MDPERMLEMCRKGQWNVDADLDWSCQPKAMDRDKEIAVVQYFTDMAGIERFAGALFAVQRRLVDDPTMKKIFATFVADEERHAVVAERLAAFYDVHHYQTYRMSPSLVAFRPHFLAALEHLTPDVANGYITAGELILDVALLRSLNDYVDDEMSHRAMELVNRDESRHIAVDFHMTEYYVSREYAEKLKSKPKPTPRERLEATLTFAQLLYHAKPFGDDVFFGPMARVDPTGRRLKEAVKRMQMIAERPEVANSPMGRFLMTVRAAASHPVLGRVFGDVIGRIGGAPVELLVRQYDDAEAARARRMTFDQMAEEALAQKAVN